MNCSIYRRLLTDKGLVVTRQPNLFYLSGMLHPEQVLYFNVTERHKMCY
ncbi:hypothetical protein BACEGG_00495 [Bacteroides eggerthii DSM 20697]|nr:hypothetical protein BACEGG_00495 [Bacteroides eggerthii DSM 20697]